MWLTNWLLLRQLWAKQRAHRSAAGGDISLRHRMCIDTLGAWPALLWHALICALLHLPVR